MVFCIQRCIRASQGGILAHSKKARDRASYDEQVTVLNVEFVQSSVTTVTFPLVERRGFVDDDTRWRMPMFAPVCGKHVFDERTHVFLREMWLPIIFRISTNRLGISAA